jgi:soluble lytic murein transglycosylase
MGNTSIKAIIPQGYDNFVISCSKTFSVPQNLIYSIIKAESMFDHQAVSSAGAAGLMQLMPATAAGLAKQLKISQYSLTNPKTSIEFGAAYTAWLNRYYKDKYIFTVAAYNACLGNEDKRKKSLDTEDMDYFTEFVPFAETNYYIVRTGKFYKQYNLIYGNK